MTPRTYIMKFGGIVLSVAAFAVIGASFSDDVWSQMARLSGTRSRCPLRALRGWWAGSQI